MSSRFSSDGLFYWDGAQWVSALSPNSRYRWDGIAWIPLQHGVSVAAQRAYSPIPTTPTPPKPQRLQTSWTTPLQLSVVGLSALMVAWCIGVIVVVATQVSGFVDRFIRDQEALHPDQPLPPPGYAESMSTTIWFALTVAALAAITVTVIVIVGAVKRWGWVHYALLVVLGLTGVDLPFSFAGALGSNLVPSGITEPAFLLWASVVIEAVSALLFTWMLVALFRRGPWAMKRQLPA